MSSGSQSFFCDSHALNVTVNRKEKRDLAASDSQILLKFIVDGLNRLCEDSPSNHLVCKTMKLGLHVVLEHKVTSSNTANPKIQLQIVTFVNFVPSNTIFA